MSTESKVNLPNKEVLTEKRMLECQLEYLLFLGKDNFTLMYDFNYNDKINQIRKLIDALQ